MSAFRLGPSLSAKGIRSVRFVYTDAPAGGSVREKVLPLFVEDGSAGADEIAARVVAALSACEGIATSRLEKVASIEHPGNRLVALSVVVEDAYRREHEELDLATRESIARAEARR
jgi:hypothetical protein